MAELIAIHKNAALLRCILLRPRKAEICYTQQDFYTHVGTLVCDMGQPARRSPESSVRRTAGHTRIRFFLPPKCLVLKTGASRTPGSLETVCYRHSEGWGLLFVIQQE